jgi:hypothetical protein
MYAICADVMKQSYDSVHEFRSVSRYEIDTK